MEYIGNFIKNPTKNDINLILNNNIIINNILRFTNKSKKCLLKLFKYSSHIHNE